MDYTFKEQIKSTREGKKLEMRAVSGTNRILARVTIQIPVLEEMEFTKIYGKNGFEEIKNAAKELCENLIKNQKLKK